MQPEDEARNEHKRVQLRELAALNGTLKARPARVRCRNSRRRRFPVIACGDGASRLVDCFSPCRARGF